MISVSTIYPHISSFRCANVSFMKAGCEKGSYFVPLPFAMIIKVPAMLCKWI